MKRTILILSLYIAGNALLLLGTDFRFSIAIIQLVIFSTWGTYRLLKQSKSTKEK